MNTRSTATAETGFEQVKLGAAGSAINTHRPLTHPSDYSRKGASDMLTNSRHYSPPNPGDSPYRGYAEYLKHPRFLAIRAQVFDRAAGKCERCGERPPTEPHHLRYPPWGAFDVPENLIAICHQCHCAIHGKDN